MITRYAFIALLFSGTALAQAPALPTAEDAWEDWYTIELIVFEQSAAGRGVPPPSVSAPDYSSAVELEEVFAAQAADPAPNPVQRPPASGLLSVPKNKYQLANVYGYLKRSAAYRPLIHLAWTQGLGPFDDMPPVRLAGGAVLVTRMPNVFNQSMIGNNPSPDNPGWPQPVKIQEVTGSAVFSMGNQPQLTLDLVLRTEPHFNPLRAASPARGNDEERFNIWHLREHRAMEPGSLHYFDHRRFGVIATVTPYVPAADQLDAAEPTSASTPDR